MEDFFRELDCEEYGNNTNKKNLNNHRYATYVINDNLGQLMKINKKIKPDCRND